MRTVCAVAALMLGAGSAHAEWLRAETDHFIIYGDTSRGAITSYAQKVERFDALLRVYYPIRIDHEIPKLEIFLAGGQDDMRRASPGISPTIGGFYSPTGGRIHAVANTESAMADDVIFHEYGHHFMFQMASNAYPAWFVEGFAEYYATVQIRNGRFQIGRINEGRMRSLNGSYYTWPPLSDVLRWRIDSRGRYRGADYYALSWAMAHYFLSDPERRRKLGVYLNAVSEGADPVDALPGTVGMTAEQLQAEIRSYVLGTMIYLTPQIDVPNPAVAVTAMTPDEGRLAWLDLRLDRMDPTEREITPTRLDGETDAAYEARTAEARAEYAEERADLIRDALAGAAVNPTDPASLKVRARAQRLSGDDDAAVATLAPLLSDGSTDARALRLAGEILLDQSMSNGEAAPAQVRQARGYLARSLDLDPLDFQTYVALDRSRVNAEGYPSPNDLTTLQVANELAPQSFDVRMRYARALMARDRDLEAVRMLSPVANSPHANATRTQARVLLAQARADAGLSVEAAGEAPPEEAPGEDAGGGG
ncbi:hypothetical protein KKHFBJBL_00435 [Brevundimonas sp. NIBR11]|nr:hypothetical protein KKHFBJBL_00435 [Brevundimonas sp. NIBR11]